jgi:hypothetical protein
LDPKNDKAFVDPAIENYWMPVDLYVGGAEHAVLHLLYSRFWHKVLYDIGAVSSDEPFLRLVNQGMILGEDNQKMSKSRGNVINPDDIINNFGADSMRVYECSWAPRSVQALVHRRAGGRLPLPGAGWATRKSPWRMLKPSAELTSFCTRRSRRSPTNGHIEFQHRDFPNDDLPQPRFPG